MSSAHPAFAAMLGPLLAAAGAAGCGGDESVSVKGGSFMMGCSPMDSCAADEKPYHPVKLAAFEIDRTEVSVGAYQACVSFMDAQVGALLDTLDRLALWDRTVVVFVSDNGIQRGEHGLWRKNVLFEESARVPLIIAAPQVARPGAPAGALVELVDLYPTVTELAGVPTPSGLGGTSLKPLLEDPAARFKEAAFTVSSRGQRLARSVRTARWRYTWWRPDAAELYDHQADPDEYHNLANDPRQRDTVARLKRVIEEAAGERLTLGGEAGGRETPARMKRPWPAVVESAPPPGAEGFDVAARAARRAGPKRDAR